MVTIHEVGEYTFPALFNHSVKTFKNCNALSFVDTTPFTYNDILQKVEYLRGLLNQHNIQKGDKVALWGANSPHWGIAYFAVVTMGAIAVPLLPDFSQDEIKTILNHANAKAMICDTRLYEKIGDNESAHLSFVLNMQDLSFIQEPNEKQATQNIAKKQPVFETDTASIIYTSGTTGRSKGVELTHKNLVFTAIQCQTVHRVNKRDKCLSFLPISHVYEFTIGFMLPFLNGACIYYLQKPPTVTTLVPALKKIRPTIVLSVPIIMEKIFKNKVLPTFTKDPFIKKLYRKRFYQKIFHRIAGISLKKTFGGRIQFFGIGGAKIDPDVEQFLKDAKFPYAIGYGLTETSPLLAGSGPKTTIPGTIGPILHGVELQIINPNPETGIGEVVARGPNVMKGYYNDPDLTQSVFTVKEDSCGEGWFKTGDLGILHNGMWLSLKGRLKNMILSSGGENIYPEDIEFIINQHSDVLESLVVEKGGGLVALVKLNFEKLKERGIRATMSNAMEDSKENFLYEQEKILSEIKYYINKKVNRFSKVEKIEPVEDFEKTAAQKIKRYLYKGYSKS